MFPAGNRTSEHVALPNFRRSEARVVAERQATRLLKLLGIKEPDVEVELVLQLPELAVVVKPDLPLSAHTEWEEKRQQWVITMNQDDSLWRSRATLAHEIKHILDDPFRELLYPDWPRQTPLAPPTLAERISDYFAGCVLVPRAWLLRAWQDGVRDVMELASLFNVSEALVAVRLKQVGLVRRRSDRDLMRSYTRRGYRRGSRFARHFAGRLALGAGQELQEVGS